MNRLYLQLWQKKKIWIEGLNSFRSAVNTTICSLRLIKMWCHAGHLVTSQWTNLIALKLNNLTSVALTSSLMSAGMSLCLGVRGFPTSGWLIVAFFEFLMPDVANCSNAASNPVMELLLFDIFFCFFCFFFSVSSVGYCGLASGSSADTKKLRKKIRPLAMAVLENRHLKQLNTPKNYLLLANKSLHVHSRKTHMRTWKIAFTAAHTWISFFVTNRCMLISKVRTRATALPFPLFLGVLTLSPPRSLLTRLNTLTVFTWQQLSCSWYANWIFPQRCL